MLKVFVSSTSQDLQEYRTAAKDVILQLNMFPIMMEYFPAMDASAVDVCMHRVDEAQIYVGIFAHRYGYCPIGSEISITEIEYNRAKENRIPRLCFIVDEKIPWNPEYIEDEPGKSKLRQFKARLDTTLVRAVFDSPQTLALKISSALQNTATLGLEHLEKSTELHPSKVQIDANTWTTYRTDYVKHLLNLKSLQENYLLYEPVFGVNQISKEISASSNLSVESTLELDNQYRPQPIIDLIGSTKRVMLLSSPGVGKTATLRYLTYYYSQLILENDKVLVPLYAHLGNYQVDQETVEKFLEDALCEQLPHMANLNQFIRYGLNEGKFIILFDALNEVSGDYQTSVVQLRKFLRQYSGCSFVFATRSTEYRNEMGIDQRIYIDTYSDTIIEAIISRTLSKNDERIKLFKKMLAHHNLIELLRNPYLLRLALQTFEITDQIPNKRTDLISLFTNHMLENESRRRYNLVKIESLRNVLTIVACRLNENARTKFTYYELEYWLKPFNEDNLLARNIEQLMLVCLSSGLWERELLSGRISFQHQILQDYFAALYLLLQFSEIGFPGIQDYLHNPMWDEAIIMATELSDAPNDLIQSIIDLPEDIFMHNWLLAARCAGSSGVPLPRSARKRLYTLWLEKHTSLLNVAQQSYLAISNSEALRDLTKAVNDDTITDAVKLIILDTMAQMKSQEAVDKLLDLVNILKHHHRLLTRLVMLLGENRSVSAYQLLHVMVTADDTPRQVRSRAILALSYYGTRDVETILVSIINDSRQSFSVRETSIGALVNIKMVSQVTRNLLRKMVRDETTMLALRQRIMLTFGIIGTPEDNDFLYTLAADTMQPWQLRTSAVRALGHLRFEQNIYQLLKLVQNRHENIQVRWNSAYALGWLLKWKPLPEGIEVLITLSTADNEQNKVRWTAVYALGALELDQYPKVVDTLINLLQNKHTPMDLRERAAEALGRSGTTRNPKVMSALENATISLEQLDIGVRMRAIRDLGRMNAHNMRDICLDIVERDDDARMHVRAVQWLGIIGEKEDIELLNRLVKNQQSDTEVRDTAFTALEQITRRYRMRVNSISNPPSPEAQQEALMANATIGYYATTHPITKRNISPAEEEKTVMAIDNSVLIAFLLEVGTWAKSELSERWLLSRKKQTGQPAINLSDEQEIRREIATELPHIIISNEEELNQAKELMTKMRKLIYEWSIEIQDIDEELNKRRIDPTAARRIKEELNEKIKNKINDIPIALSRIGLDIMREKLS